MEVFLKTVLVLIIATGMICMIMINMAFFGIGFDKEHNPFTAKKIIICFVVMLICFYAAKYIIFDIFQVQNH